MTRCAQLFIDLLNEKEYNFSVNEISDGGIVVNFPYQGKVTRCVFTGDNGEYLSLYLVFEKVPEEKAADIIFLSNELNKKYKWVTFFLDDDSDLMLHDDAILSPESAANETLELLVRMIDIGNTVKPVVMKTIYA